ncbi:MAG: VCBS repeat-containing protein [Alphaproteobacteria bacterium]|nr:VCBS repeat-containing protein [Alphaproteobacteria bacterium]
MPDEAVDPSDVPAPGTSPDQSPLPDDVPAEPSPDTDAADTDAADTDDLVPVRVPGVPPVLSGGFVDISGPLAAHPLFVVPGDVATRVEPSPTGGYFADVDADGDTEVVVTTQRVAPVEGPVTQARVFDWDTATGTLVYDAVASPMLESVQDLVILATDLDRDALPDLVLGIADRGLSLGAPTGFPSNAPLPVLRQDGDRFGTFGAVAPVDADQDGWLDLVLGDRSCTAMSRTLRLLLGTGQGAWVDRSDLVDDVAIGSPWAVLAAPTPGGDVVLANIGTSCSAAAPQTGFFGVSAHDADGYPRWTAFDPTPPTALFRQLTTVAGGPFTDLSPMAAALVDLDNDGELDFVGAADSDLYPIFGGWGRATMTEQSWRPATRWPTAGDPMFAWGTLPLDVDNDGRADLIVAHGDDTGTFFDERIGPQVVRLLWNDGAGGFVDLGSQTGLDLPGSWRSLAAGDPDGDGDLDLVVGGNGAQPRVYRNDVAGRGQGLTLRLRGTSSNALALGAWVEVIDPDVPGSVHLVGETWSPTIWNAPVLGLGLGDDPVLDTLRITWPTGVVQEVHGLTAGALHELVEPPSFEVTPSTRRVPADGRATVDVTVMPRALDGAIDTGATVEVTLATGAGTWLGPATVDAQGTWHRTLQAPTTAGTATVRITVDGVDLRVRPRLWFDDAH